MANIKQVSIKFYNNNSISESIGVFPVNESIQNNISFSHEWWNPVEESLNFLQNVFDAMDVNYLSAAVSGISEVQKIMGESLKPLNQYAKAWKGPGQPFTITLQLSFRFGQNNIYNGYEEVVYPILNIVKRTLPVLKSPISQGTAVQGPGPKPIDILILASQQMTGILNSLPLESFRTNTEKYRSEFINEYNRINQIDYSSLPSQDRKFTYLGNLKRLAELANNGEMRGFLLSYIGRANIDAILEENKDIFSLEPSELAERAANYQIPRTWELQFGRYLFKYLVCVDSNFSFEPEVDSNGWPIQGSINLNFQPYLVALANNIGTPATGQTTTITGTDGSPKVSPITYGWSERSLE